MKLGFALLAALLGNNEVGAKEIRSLAEGQGEVPTTDRPPWWDLGLADEVLNEVGLFYLGQAWYQATDVGEMLETFGRCNASDPWSWTLEFRKTSDRLEKLAKESADAGHHRSAGHYYLRAATYRRAALHRHPDPFHEEVPIQAQLAVDAFKKFLTEFEYPCESVEIPYEATTLPGYLCINPNIDGPAPTIIFQEGKDGWAEDGKFIVDEAASRGYNVLLFDGPGIGKVMRTQGLPFRYDWENVITPIVDHLIEMDEVDENNIALVAVSLGGYLGPRAAAFEPRIKALIANPGVIDWSLVYSDFLNEIDPNLMRLLEADPASFDKTIAQIMQHSPLMEWGMIDSMWHHNKTTPSQLMEEIGRFNNRDTAKDITACTLVIDADAETRGQSLELFDSLVNCPRKDYVKFTTEEAAQLHVQPGATAILSARMFNWLDEVFAMDISGADATEAGIKSPATHSTLSASVLVIGSAVVALALAN